MSCLDLIISRSVCGLADPKRRPSAMSTPEGIVVHCTAGKQPTSPEDSLERWRRVQRFHQGSQREWADIGYNFGFDDFGQLLEGRGWGAQGAHAKGLNATHHGLCYLGSGEEPTCKACPGDGVAAHLEARHGFRNPYRTP